MATGTFPKVTMDPDSEGHALGSMQNPNRPDFSSLGYAPYIWEYISETDTTMTIRYQVINNA